MYHKMLINSRFHELLVVIDDYLAEAVRSLACDFCGGPLHKANYPRSPLGYHLIVVKTMNNDAVFVAENVASAEQPHLCDFLVVIVSRHQLWFYYHY